ncbi:PPE family protein [Mycobacterium haemophilum DSM 44634]|uniref:PPE family protein n=1 Tax=Mycobacterium haemophilum TaxID=29311 RepID=UPI000655A270|nr:PPE family protein [Mycobacterium haemophilum]MCV7341346.1 PPE family protein [Mycobacterium haemophilum DSM 44634]
MPHSEGLPPEINSANMLGGPGPFSMAHASMKWMSLGKEMWDLKMSFDQMLTCLTEEWSGEVAMQAINAAKPFQEWLEDLSDQIMNIARQTHYIMRAFRLAHYDVVDPELINANRAQVLALLQDNELGQNTAAIAQLEHEYADYWDQDGDAMRTYRHDLSVALTSLTPWQQPPPIANNTGLVASMPRAADRFGL